MSAPQDPSLLQRFTAPPDAETQRLDRFLAGRLSAFSRGRLQRLIRDGHVEINGRAATRPAGRVAPGSVVTLRLPEEDPDQGIRPAPQIQYGLLHEDESLLVIDKPPGLVVHPAVGHAHDTLVHALLARYPDLAAPFADESEDEAFRPGIVHRLDRDTSGVIVVARRPEVAAALKAQFKARSVAKTYVALVRGQVHPPAGLIDAPIGRDPRNRQRMHPVPDGRAARTAFRLLADAPGYSWLELKPETGRTHQIRVHLKAIGHPVVGDPVYGRGDHHIARLALHAMRLGFEHPTTGRSVTFEAPLPDDLRAALAAIGIDEAVPTQA